MTELKLHIEFYLILFNFIDICFKIVLFLHYTYLLHFVSADQTLQGKLVSNVYEYILLLKI